ncbi:MAG: undecaprenyl-diphosphate phosphatase [Sphingobium sp.]|jgi:undecaprenyl-diphosphatase|uniref:undecaprenyl-diphosphate phosphatase n=1 Tax=Sphingobium sp. TaxID=1912891 RepID=UPI000C37EF2D|nr:undecaprenyl-diphosphate phosphatase [Sphingobium sp.]MBU0660198.1 undecaprenyl-diphosphate phosphatase [Alphaproteobacteria bacterium]MBA4755349.1 undecaprenyl-diphosphate phosphatase [Sphingobium sp.]MBS89972.1 undecaprenyl-diphosphatase [Sphingobium sp.]MBU0775827.1 undecaprenyl-diphosphate phosphatase [Alphaproteobacteria bacterium]MBU0868454.1 undecaprenyl-diphosphate phosphatase [Alphaproteobacteria bacterium]
MDLHYLTVILLGIVEGLTEFLPVSSTGHLILASELLGYDASTWAMFNVVIQLGAILAVVVLYWRTFWAVGMGLLRREPVGWRFLRNLLIAFMPSAVIGLALHDYIEILLGAPQVVAWALIAGGIAILLIERAVKDQRFHGIADIPTVRVLAIGFIQCLAMVPGVSRSGATIMGALMLGVERRTAAEFSFFLAIPTMLGATALELIKKGDQITSAAVGWGSIALGFVVSFIVALLVIRWFVGLVSKHGFAPFAWYRIVAGVAALIWLEMR